MGYTEMMMDPSESIRCLPLPSADKKSATRNVIIVLCLSVAMACGGSDSSGGNLDTSGLIGLWSGSTTVSVNGQTATSTAYTHISGAGSDLTIGDVCGNGTGPSATASSATQFTIHPFSCPPGVLGSCSSVVLSVSGGNGSLSSGTLTVSMSGAATGCNASYPFTFSFSGHK
jgi:hypothetical protein